MRLSFVDGHASIPLRHGLLKAKAKLEEFFDRSSSRIEDFIARLFVLPDGELTAHRYPQSYGVLSRVI